MSVPARSIRYRFLRLVSRCALSTVYGGTVLFADLFLRLRRKRPTSRAPGVLLLTSTFHNPNWYLAHVTPLARAGFREVVVVADGHVREIRGVRVVVPPVWLTRLVSRAGAKFVILLWLGLRLRPSMVMGYHIFPSAISALLAGTLSGSKTAYQIAAGPAELEGGGWRAENRVLSALGSPSRMVERLAYAVTRRFDLVVVRGAQARAYVTEHCGSAGRTVIITASVDDVGRVADYAARDYDVIFVGRLTEVKRLDRFVLALAAVAAAKPNVRAAVVGDGPDTAEVKRLIDREGLTKNIELLGLREDVPDLLARSRVLLLTSRSEGVSIAVLEAMMHGVVPVVSDVGDLRDVVVPGETGCLVPQNDVACYADNVIRLLSDADYWSRLSQSARARALTQFSTEAVAASWADALKAVGGL